MTDFEKGISLNDISEAEFAGVQGRDVKFSDLLWADARHVVAQAISGLADTELAQTSPRSGEYKEDLSSAASRTNKYGERATQESDTVIAESGDSATSLAGWQVDAAREV